jgi:hypothetical protein
MFADQQKQQQSKGQGKMKISSAAEALNAAELGISSTETEQNEKTVMSISSDQLFVNGDRDDNEKVISPLNITQEAAAITIAKQAAQQYV